MNYEWTPITEPPEDNRDVIVWVSIDQGYWITSYYTRGDWYNDNGDVTPSDNLTHWKDIKPPTK